MFLCDLPHLHAIWLTFTCIFLVQGYIGNLTLGNNYSYNDPLGIPQPPQALSN